MIIRITDMCCTNPEYNGNSVSVELYDLTGNPENVELKFQLDDIKDKLEQIIRGTIENFKREMLEAFKNETDFDEKTVYIFKAGNSSRNEFVDKIMKDEFPQNNRIKLVDETAKNDDKVNKRYAITPKTAVAFGQLKLNNIEIEGDDATFRYYLGYFTPGKNKFKVCVDKNAADTREWHKFQKIKNDQIDVFYARSMPADGDYKAAKHVTLDVTGHVGDVLFIRMGYNKEYNADQVLEILKMDDPVSEFEKSMDNMSAFLSYASAENAHIIADKIREEHEKDWKIYIKGVIKMYPLSDQILSSFTEHYRVSDMKEDIINWFDTSEVIMETVNKLTSVLAEINDFEKEKSELEEQMAELTEKMARLETSRKALHEKEEKCRESKGICEDLERKIKTLNEQLEEYSDDSIDRKTREVEKLINQKDKQQKKYNETLSKYNKELEKYEGSDSDFDKAMDAFGKLVKVLPKDEADN